MSESIGDPMGLSRPVGVGGRVGHRRGRRVEFVAPVKGPSASRASVLNTVAHEDAREALIEGVTAAVMLWPYGADYLGDTLSGSQLREITADRLFPVRRPLSYKGMKNYVGCFAPLRGDESTDPTGERDERLTWFESFNERTHFRCLSMRHRGPFASQPMRLQWTFADGIRTHVPDALLTTSTGTTLVDVTTRKKLTDELNLAIFTLTRETARSLGWDYQLRTEMPEQVENNVDAVWAAKSAQKTVQSWLRPAPPIELPVQVGRLGTLLGGIHRGVDTALSMTQQGRAHFDLEKPLAPDTWLTAGPYDNADKSWLVTL